ncbi:MAG: MoaF N-terminal domain-containing protein [Flavobacteriaceae bacterium]
MRLATLILVFLTITSQTIAQEKQEQQLLDGTSVDYTYENGSAVRAEFLNGQFNYKWIAGPNKGAAGSEKYLSRRIGAKMYMVSFMVEANKSFATIIFNFKKKIIATSALIAPGTDQEIILFDTGIIEQLNLKEN